MMKRIIVIISAAIALFSPGSPVRSAIGSFNISRTQEERPYASFVSYLETTDVSQYVMTPMRFMDIPYSRIEIRWTLAPDAYYTNRGICGAFQSSSGGYFMLICGSRYYSWALGGWSNNITTKPIGNRSEVNGYTVVVDLPNDYVQVNGAIVDGSPMDRWNNNVREAIKNGTSPFVLFRGGMNRDCITGLRIHHCKIWISDELVFDARPCRIGEEGFMYDAVTDQYLGNLGSGAFAVGPDVAW